MKFYQRILFFILAVTMLFCLASCSAQTGDESDVPLGFVLAENEGSDYSFYYPQEWILDRSDAGMTSVYVSDVDFSNVTMTAFTADVRYTENLALYLEEYYCKQLEGNLKDFKPETAADDKLVYQTLTVDDCPALAFNYTASVYDVKEDQNISYGYRVWLIRYGAYIYHVQYCAKNAEENDLFQTHYDEAETIVTGIQFH